MAALSDKQFIYLGGAAIVGVIALYILGKKAVVAAADAGAGIVTGTNALTKDTPYQDKGIVGTLGAAANAASGGALQQFGEWLGGKTYDLLGPDEQNINEQQSKSAAWWDL